MKLDKLLLAHGGGGEETFYLIKDIFLKYFSNPILEQLEDAAVLQEEKNKFAFTIDGFTVKPIFLRVVI